MAPSSAVGFIFKETFVKEKKKKLKQRNYLNTKTCST